MHDGSRGGLAREAALSAGIVLFWAAPALPRLLTHLRDGYDALFSAWALAWIRHALATAPWHLLDGNAFAPAPRALAHSDPLVGYGLLSTPFATWGAVGAQNLTCLFATALSLFAVVRLARSLGATLPAAAVGAACACLGALAATDLGYVPFTAFGGIALCVLAWRALLSRGSVRDAALLGLAAGLLGLFSVQLLLFGAAGVGLVAFVDLVRERRRIRPSFALRLLLAGVVAGAVLAPLAIPLLAVRRAAGFSRSSEEMLRYSATLRDWSTTSPYVPGQRFLGRTSGSETSLYPGTLALLLAAAAFVLPAGRRSRLIVPGAVLALAGIGFSLGPRGPGWLLVHGPPALLFGSIRAFARFAFVAQIGFALLAAAGADALLARLARKRARAAAVAALACAAFLDVRQRVAFPFRPDPPSAADRLAVTLPAPILHLPFTTRADDARWLFASIPTFRPVVNGYASFTPRAHEELAAEFSGTNLGTATLERLAAWPVGTLVVHEHALPLASYAATLRLAALGLRGGSLRLAAEEPHRGGVDDVLVFGPGPARDPSALLARADAARPAPEGAETDFFAGLDDLQPLEGALVIRGWSQTVPGPSEILDVTIDGERRLPLAATRYPRPDACAVFPQLRDCARAGFEYRFVRLPQDAGKRAVRMVLRAPDGRWRTLARDFDVAP